MKRLADRHHKVLECVHEERVRLGPGGGKKVRTGADRSTKGQNLFLHTFEIQSSSGSGVNKRVVNDVYTL